MIAPRSGPVDHGLHGARAAFLRSVPLPGYPEVRVTFAGARRLAGVLADFRPDLVHLASPFVLGWQGVLAAERLDVPSVAVYQTDVPAYAERYRLPGAAPAGRVPAVDTEIAASIESLAAQCQSALRRP